jgi:prepilin-type N-terminal cleavage/methylation domain-containing protein
MSRNTRPRRSRRHAGFTLVEAAVALAVFSILIVSVLSIALETSTFIGQADVDFSVQAEANRAHSRLAEVLRKAGWNTAGGVTYPRVIDGGAALEFRVLKDLDGNGYAFGAASGELEWGPLVYTVRLDPASGILSILQNGVSVLDLGRNIQAVGFASYQEDNSLHFKEIQVSMVASKSNKDGVPTSYTSVNSIHMRN